MIVKMKKTTLLVLPKEKQKALKKLRNLGVLHVQHVQTPHSEDIDQLNSQLSNAEKALYLLNDFTAKEKDDGLKGEAVVTQLLDWVTEKNGLQTRLNEKLETRKWFDVWGGYSPASLKALEAAGLTLRCYRLDKNAFSRIPEDYSVEVLKEEKGQFFTVLVSQSPDQQLDAQEELIPRVDLTALNQEINTLTQQIQSIDEKIAGYAKYTDTIKQYQTHLKKELEYHSVLSGLGDREAFIYLQGFVPEEFVDNVKAKADSEGWGYIFEEPEDPAEVPTLLKNNKAVRIVQPMFDFMGTLPGYTEVDVSFVFLLFFSLFYAMIIGDAGYGLVFLGGTFLMRKKYKKAPVEPFALFYVLSFTTIIWGCITGTWFGSRAIAELPGLRSIIIEPMFSFNKSREATIFMMRFSFILGLIQLVIAHFMAFLKKLPSIKAVAELGWILICIGMYFVVDLLVLNNALPGFVIPLLISGITIVGIFTKFTLNPLKMVLNFLVAILSSLQDTISAFSDIISYIRLFAVGLAGVTVAASFNDMAGGIAAPLVLVLGHALNIVLGLMSVLVHGVRLNMLEFSGHLGQQWTGMPYQPFKE